jgi:phospholipase C
MAARGEAARSAQPSRRRFLTGLAGAGATVLAPPVARSAARRPRPRRSAIRHVVVVMMENRSFDHLLGWLPNADGAQAGLVYPDGGGALHATHRLAPDWTGCGHADPDHSYAGGRRQYRDGAMDGLLLAGTNDNYAIGYYEEADRPFLAALARHYTTLDRGFCSVLGPTFPNRFFLHAAQTDRLDNSLGRATMPTIWDRLVWRGIHATYYYSNLPFLALWGRRYLPLARRYEDFLAAAARGALPAVSFVEPRFTLADSGRGNDDHPHADIRRGDAFLAEVFHALAGGPDWDGTVLIVTYDEWGGFFDHVTPPRAQAPNAVDPDLVGGKALLGLRVPVVIASPFTRGDPDDPRVRHATADHTSILKLIEWRFRLAPLTARDASADVSDLVRILDLESPREDVPDLPAPAAPAPRPCAPPAPRARRDARAAHPAPDSPWADLARSPLLEGWSAERS